MNNHLMLDLETFGTSRDAMIVSIGACWFDPLGTEVAETYHEKICLGNEEVDGKMDLMTVLWWLKQTKEAQSLLMVGGTKHLREALQAFREFVPHSRECEGLWSNGPTFDEVILQSAFNRVKLGWPFYYHTSRDFRTIVQVGQVLGLERPKHANAHDALADAVAQAKHVQAVFRRLHETLS